MLVVVVVVVVVSVSVSSLDDGDKIGRQRWKERVVGRVPIVAWFNDWGR